MTWRNYRGSLKTKWENYSSYQQSFDQGEEEEESKHAMPAFSDG